MYVNSKFFNCESTWFLLWVVEPVVYYCGWLSSLQKKKTFGKSLLQAFGYTCLRCVFKNCTILVCNVQNALICHCEMFCVVYQILKFLVQNAVNCLLFLIHINRNRMCFIDCLCSFRRDDYIAQMAFCSLWAVLRGHICHERIFHLIQVWVQCWSWYGIYFTAFH